MSNPEENLGLVQEDQTYVKPDGAGKPVVDMTDRQLLEELVWQLRSVGKMLDEFKHMGPADIMKLFMPSKR